MNSQDFLIVNVVCAALFILWYWRGRESTIKKPTTLNMHAPDSAPLIIPPENAAALSSPTFARNAIDTSAAGLARAKVLNVIFNYNGHAWDAYEVLGVPAGSQLREVTAAYQEALKKTDTASHPFLETAYKSILHRF